MLVLAVALEWVEEEGMNDVVDLQFTEEVQNEKEDEEEATVTSSTNKKVQFKLEQKEQQTGVCLLQHRV